MDARAVMLTVLRNTTHDSSFISSERRNDREIMYASVLNNGFSLFKAPPHMQTDRALVMAAVKHDGLVLRFANQLNNDREIVLEAIKQNPVAFQYASAELQSDPELIAIANGEEIELTKACR